MIRLPLPNGAWLFAPTIAILLPDILSSASDIFAKEMTPARIDAATSTVDTAMVNANTARSQNWPTIALDYTETRFSKLNQITSDNVKGLGLVWSYASTPSGESRRRPSWSTASCCRPAWSIVHAIDARTGKKIWSFDPGVNRD